MNPSFGSQNIKKPNVSGQFYESDPARLKAQIKNFFKSADVEPSGKKIDIIISPHAGYVYSGPVAAYGYKAAIKNKYSTVIILGPSHYYGFREISIWNEGSFETPLGSVEVDGEMAEKIIDADEDFINEPRAFDREHSVEVQIPFLQYTFKDFKIVPVVMGQAGYSTLEKFAETLKRVIGDRDDVLIVVSTDLSHYHPDKTAKNMDRQAISAVEKMNAEGIYEECSRRIMEMCGYVPVTAAILYARLKGLDNPEVLHYANSGDVTGDLSGVVGYSSIVFYENGKIDAPESASKNEDKKDKDAVDPNALNLKEKKELLEIARNTIEEYVGYNKTFEPQVNDPRLSEEEGAFVTLHENGMLRGCIGNIIGSGPLYLTVRNMAIASATQDPRFPPLKKNEIDKIEIEISVLTKPRKIKNIDEFVLGKHGVIITRGFNSGVFLPQVADETGWTKEEFLSNLCSHKAGLPPDAWKDPKTTIEIYEAQVFSEKTVK